MKKVSTILVMDLSNNHGDQERMSSIALLLYEDNILIEKKSLKFNYNSDIPQDGCVDLYEVWPTILPFFEKTEFVICFNAGVHKSTLRKSLEKENIVFPQNKYFDLLNFARVSLPNLDSWDRYKLATHFNIDTPLPFDLDEAYFSKALLDKLLDLYENKTLEEVYNERLERKKENVTSFFKSTSGDADMSEVEFAKETLNPTNFINRKFVLTGFDNKDKARIEQILKENGGIQVTGVSKVVDYLIIGDSPGPSKIAKAVELNKNGFSIKYISAPQIEEIFF